MLFEIIPWLFVLGVLGALATFPWGRAAGRRRLFLLAVLGVPPAAAYIWGRLFAVEPGAGGHVAAWVPGFLWLALVTSLVLPLPLIVRMAGARWFTASVGLAVAALTAVVCFVSVMSVTGDWI